MQNIVIKICEKFHYDRLRNDRALGNGNSDNNKNNNKKDNVGSAWGPVSGSNNILQLESLSELLNSFKFNLIETKGLGTCYSAVYMSRREQ